ncbi:MAG: 3-oxoacyl-ACP reductase FabG [Bacteroidota bacterium]
MKIALVTGGSRGIGKAICLKLAELGYFVLINFHSNKQAAEETLAEVKAKGSDGELMMFDVADETQVQSILGTWLENHKETPVEILVNNAGIKNDTLLMWMSTKQWKDVINTSVDGFFNVTKLVVQGMLVKKYGRIVNVVSLSGLKGMPGQTNYSAAKAAVIGATKALAQEVGRRNITVNAVAPGFITTDMTKEIDEKSFKALIPVARFGRPEEVAEAVCFLASEKASYITGAILNVNGGLYT